MIKDTADAFVRVAGFPIRPAAAGRLSGLKFAAKDLFDIAGMVTGAGNPTWAETHEPAEATAPAVARLIDEGAMLMGKTHTDELAFSLNGENAHYGTPHNSAAPERIPGGSSSGSVAAVAAGLVDFALGTDTGGSVRVPASYCGVFGIRTTHGAIDTTGMVALAPSFDTVGWFAREPEVMHRVGRAYFDRDGVLPNRLVVARDAFAVLDGAVRRALDDAVASLRAAFPDSAETDVAPDGLDAWFTAFRSIQTYEAWATHGAWIGTARPAFGPGIAERFAAGSRVGKGEKERADALRARVRAAMRALLPRGTVLLLPSAPGPAPIRNTAPEKLEGFRARAMHLTAIAGNAGLPQVSLPLARFDGAPVGLSLMGGPDTDMDLLSAACAIWSAR